MKKTEIAEGLTKFEFDSASEADAFVSGVEFVNDSVLKIERVGAAGVLVTDMGHYKGYIAEVSLSVQFRLEAVSEGHARDLIEDMSVAELWAIGDPSSVIDITDVWEKK